MITLSFRMESKRQVNLFVLAAIVTTSVGTYRIRWSVETHGDTYVYWCVLVVRGTEYTVSYDKFALGDATLSWTEISRDV